MERTTHTHNLSVRLFFITTFLLSLVFLFDVVLVFYPLGLDKIALYALEQYLLRGGNVIVMLDSFAEERFIGKNKYFSYKKQILNRENIFFHNYQKVLTKRKKYGKIILGQKRMVGFMRLRAKESHKIKFSYIWSNSLWQT